MARTVHLNGTNDAQLKCRASGTVKNYCLSLYCMLVTGLRADDTLSSGCDYGCINNDAQLSVGSG
jgi:hypothetical protein